MVYNYQYPYITIDSRLIFSRHVTETKRKVDSRFSMTKTIRNLKIGVNTRTDSRCLYTSLDIVILYAAPGLRFCHTFLGKKTNYPTTLYLGPYQSNKLNPGIQIIRNRPHPSINKKETVRYLLKQASKPIVHRVQYEIQTVPESIGIPYAPSRKPGPRRKLAYHQSHL